MKVVEHVIQGEVDHQRLTQILAASEEPLRLGDTVWLFVFRCARFLLSSAEIEQLAHALRLKRSLANQLKTNAQVLLVAKDDPAFTWLRLFQVYGELANVKIEVFSDEDSAYERAEAIAAQTRFRPDHHGVRDSRL